MLPLIDNRNSAFFKSFWKHTQILIIETWTIFITKNLDLLKAGTGWKQIPDIRFLLALNCKHKNTLELCFGMDEMYTI